MNNLYEWISNPSTIINIVVLVFSLGTIWANFNNKQRELESRIRKLEDLDLDSRLTQMQIDLDWVKKTLDELKIMVKK